MPSTLDDTALRLCRALAEATSSRPMHWRGLATIVSRARIHDDQVDAAVERCIANGWLLIEGGHSICLTDEGRRAAA